MASFDSLDSLLKTHQNVGDQRVSEQMAQVFSMVRETLTQAKHHGNGLQQFAKEQLNGQSYHLGPKDPIY